MTEAAIETITPENAAQKLRDKNRLAFAELVPPEQFEKLIQAELTSFLKVEVDRWDSSKRHPSPFATLCRSVFEEHVRATLKEELRKPEYQQECFPNGLSPFVEEWLTKNAEALVQSTVRAFAAQAAQSLVVMMQNSIRS